MQYQATPTLISRPASSLRALVAMMGSSISELGNYIYNCNYNYNHDYNKPAPSLHAMMTGTVITDIIVLGKCIDNPVLAITGYGENSTPWIQYN